MKFNFYLILFTFFLFSCVSTNYPKMSKKHVLQEKFSNSGFALVYNDSLYKNNVVNKKLNNRDLLVFQRNLKKGTSVKITNPLNNNTVIGKVGKNSIYPNFNNSVISIRIAEELELDTREPYVIIEQIIDNALFVAKKAKTYDQEKQVANKAPVETISVNDLNKEEVKEVKNKVKKKFSYNIKIADFYFEKTAIKMVDRILNETNIKFAKIDNIEKNKFRVYLGPYSNLKALQKAYNSVENLEFENIEIIKND